MFLLIWKGINAWEFTTQTRTMFEFGHGKCEMTKNDLVIFCK